MKIILFLLILSASTVASGDTVKKWTDEKGKVHYGDKKAAENIKGSETLIIEDTYDQQSYDEGIQRHKETEKFADQYEKERLAEEKRKQEEADSKPSSRSPPAGGTAVRFPVGEKHPRKRKDNDPSESSRPPPKQLPAHRPPRQRSPTGTGAGVQNPGE